DAATGQPAPFGVFLSRQDAEILDTWHTVGMRGTGSADIAATEAFVPDRRVFPVAPLANPAPGFEGPLYRMFPFTAVLGEATVSVRVAAGGGDRGVQLGRTETAAHHATPLGQQPCGPDARGQGSVR